MSLSLYLFLFAEIVLFALNNSSFFITYDIIVVFSVLILSVIVPIAYLFTFFLMFQSVSDYFMLFSFQLSIFTIPPKGFHIMPTYESLSIPLRETPLFLGLNRKRC